MSPFEAGPVVVPFKPTPDEKPPVVIVEQRTGRDHQGEFLLTIWSDGTHEIAWREQSWETWSPPIKLEAVAL